MSNFFQWATQRVFLPTASSLRLMCILCLLCVLPVAAKDEIVQGKVTLTPTKIGKITVLKGTYEVFEDRRARKGRRIPLDIIIAPAWGEKVFPDPIFAFSGGPGAAATSWAMGLEDIAFMHKNRDIVLIAQRGTGKSNGLFCQRPGDPQSLQSYLGSMYEEKYVKACRETLEKRADLGLYTTELAMDDINEVRAALGYDQINLIGTSYGGRAVLTYIRRHESTVRSAVAEFPSPPWQAMPSTFAVESQNAMDRMLTDCNSEPSCFKRFPDIKEKVKQAFAHFDQGPLRVSMKNPMNGKKETVSFERGVFASLVRSWLYAPESTAYLPMLIENAAKGHFEKVILLAVGSEKTMSEFIADGMYLSVTCAEDVPYFNHKQWAKASQQSFLRDYRIVEQVRGCRLWVRGEISDVFRKPFKSKVPILLVTGELDPVTPPHWSEEIAKHMPNATHLHFPKAAHGGDQIYSCYDPILAEFFNKGNGAELNLDCAKRVKRPPFVTDVQAFDKYIDKRIASAFGKDAK